MNFVFVSLQRINTDRESTSTSLAKELAKEHQVLYVNPPIDRRTWFSKNNDKYIQAHINAIKENKAGLVNELNGLSVLSPEVVIESLNWIPLTPVFSFFNRINNKKFASSIQRALDKLGFDSFILINDKDMFRSFYLKEILKPFLYIYLDRDFTLGFDYWKKHGVVLEPLLMRKSDAVVCNSTDFTRRASQYNKNSFYIGNGADLEVFDNSKTYSKPHELLTFSGPIIGYIGALNSMRIDINLIAAIAAQRTDWNFIFIGEEDHEFTESALHDLVNVTFLKKKHTTEVPAFVKYFDVCINPQLINEITIGNFPLKIVEYLALGKPVVATATNTMKEVFSEMTYLAVSSGEFVASIEIALKEDSPALQMQRTSFAKKFSWHQISDKLLGYIKQVSGGKGIRI